MRLILSLGFAKMPTLPLLVILFIMARLCKLYARQFLLRYFILLEDALNFTPEVVDRLLVLVAFNFVYLLKLRVAVVQFILHSLYLFFPFLQLFLQSCIFHTQLSNPNFGLFQYNIITSACPSHILKIEIEGI